MKTRGFTLVEVMLSMAAGTIVLLSIAISLTAAHRFWWQAFRGTQLQRDASHAMQVMTNGIRNGGSAAITAGGKTLQVERATGWIRYSYNLGQQRLECQRQGSAPWTVSENVQLITFNQTADQIGIVLELNRGNKTVRCETSVLMRNTGG